MRPLREPKQRELRVGAALGVGEDHPAQFVYALSLGLRVVGEGRGVVDRGESRVGDGLRDEKGDGAHEARAGGLGAGAGEDEVQGGAGGVGGGGEADGEGEEGGGEEFHFGGFCVVFCWSSLARVEWHDEKMETKQFLLGARSGVEWASVVFLCISSS